MASIRHRTKRQDKGSPKAAILHLEQEEGMEVSMGELTGLDWRTDRSRNECALVNRTVLCLGIQLELQRRYTHFDPMRFADKTLSVA